MDVSSMIKVNELAKELVDKGIAPSSEEASKMAEKFLQKEVLPKHSKKTDDYDKYEVLLNRLQRKFDNEIISLKEQLTSIINELNFIKGDIKKIELEEKQSTLADEDKEKKPFNQRTGNLKPGDVNIEDYFYYGDKKKN